MTEIRDRYRGRRVLHSSDAQACIKLTSDIKFSCKNTYLETKVGPGILKAIQKHQRAHKSWLQGSKQKLPFLSGPNGTCTFQNPVQLAVLGQLKIQHRLGPCHRREGFSSQTQSHVQIEQAET